MPQNSEVNSSIDTQELQTIRSEEVQEILGKAPSWILRSSLWFLLAFLAGFFLLASLIAYPDVVKGQVILTSNPPPLRLYPRSSGELRLFVQDGETVKAGQTLALIRNATNYEDLQKLEKLLDQYREQGFVVMLSEKAQKLQLGELQSSYHSFLSACQNWALYESLGKSAQELANLSAQIAQQKQLNQNLQTRHQLQEQTLAYGEHRFKADSLLHSQEVTSKFEFWQSKADRLQQYQNLKSSEANLLSDAVNLENLKANIRKLRLEDREQSQKLALDAENTYQMLLSQIQQWKTQYLLRASYAGKVSFLGYWANHQFVTGDKAVLSVIPHAKNLLGKVQISANTSQKVAIGQKVQIRLAQYPPQEYGYLEAWVSQISAVTEANREAQELQYTITVILKNGLETTDGQVIPNQAEFLGEASIITEKRSLLLRLFAPLWEVLKSS